MRCAKELILYNTLFFFGFFADRLTKAWALMTLHNQEQMIVNDYLNLSFIWNAGISLSMLQPKNFFGFVMLTTIILIVLALFLIYVIDTYRHGGSIIFEVIVLAGAFSNIVDRLWYGAVIDFIEFHFKNWYFPTFNVADVCVCIGVFGILTKSFGLWSKK